MTETLTGRDLKTWDRKGALEAIFIAGQRTSAPIPPDTRRVPRELPRVECLRDAQSRAS